MGVFVVRGLNFSDQDVLPTKYTNEGKGVSPGFRWKNPAALFLCIRAYSLSDIGKQIEHWLVYDIPTFHNQIEEDFSNDLGTTGLNQDGIANYLAPDATSVKSIRFEFYSYRTKVNSSTPLNWIDTFNLINQSTVRGPRIIETFYPQANPVRMVTAPYEYFDLGPQIHHTHDPKIANGIVLAGKDRCGSDKYSTTAAIWNGGWTLLKDPDHRETFSSSCLGGRSTRIVGLVDYSKTEGDACFWDSPNDIQILPKPAGANQAFAYDVSDDGNTIVGCCSYAKPDQLDDALIWEYDGTQWQVDILPAIGFRALAVGWDDSTKTVFGTVWGVKDLLSASWTRNASGSWIMSLLALDTNPYSQIDYFDDGIALGAAGRSEPVFELSATAWDNKTNQLNSGLPSLSFFTGHYDGKFVGIDASGTNDRAFAWSKLIGKTDIHPPFRRWSIATGIDKNGWIVGVAGDTSMHTCGDNTGLFLLKPKS